MRFLGEYQVPFRRRTIWCGIVGRETDRPPLVCVPGGPGLPHDYLASLAGLARRGRQVVFYDPLGSGRSERPAHAAWSLEVYVDEAAAVCRHLRLDRYHLFAHSAAGFVALSRALAHPPELMSLVLSSTPVSFPEHRTHVRRALRQLGFSRKEVAAFEEAERTQPTRNVAYARIYDRYFRRYGCRVRPIPPGLREAVRRINPVALRRLKGGHVFYHSELADWDVTPRLGEIDVPVLYTCGRLDLIPISAAADVVRRIPRAELEIFERSAHTAHVEEPDAYRSCVAAFLERSDCVQALRPERIERRLRRGSRQSSQVQRKRRT